VRVQVGEAIPEWVMPSVKAERMLTMAAILRDPNPLHWDRDAVAALPLGLGKRTINQGPLGLAYIINMLHCWVGPENLRRIRMTFPEVVLDGECVIARGVVTSLEGEMAQCEVWLEEQSRGRLLQGTAWVCVPA
jgi:acyl dehydratase